MVTVIAIGAIVLFCLGGLVGATWTTQAMGNVSRRHAAERRALNDEWAAVTDARIARGEPAYCGRCHKDLLTEANRPLVAQALLDEENDEA